MTDGLSVLFVIVYVFNFIDRNILSILAEDIKRDLGVTDAPYRGPDPRAHLYLTESLVIGPREKAG